MLQLNNGVQLAIGRAPPPSWNQAFDLNAQLS
jgi:hypothetical protein